MKTGFYGLFIRNDYTTMTQKIQLTENELRGYVEKMVRESLYQLAKDGMLEEGKFARALGAAALGAGLMFGHPQDANAQLNIRYQQQQGPQKLKTIIMSQSWLYKTTYGYEIWMITSNKFDSYNTLFLGETEESALLTLKDLKGLIENKVSGTVVQQYDGDVYLMYRNELGVKQLQIKTKKNAGYSWLSLGNINDLMKYFESEQTYQMTSQDFDQSMSNMGSEEDVNGGQQDDAPEFTEYRKLKAYLRQANQELSAAQSSGQNDPGFIRIKKEQIKKIQARMREIENMYAQKGQKIQ